MDKMLPKGYKDYSGETRGSVKVLRFVGMHEQPSGVRKTVWECLCVCGEKFDAVVSTLKDSPNTSCGCIKLGKRPNDIVGKRFGRLVVKSFHGWVEGSKPRLSLWDCSCDCGGNIIMRRSYLTTTPVPSCGCYKSERLREARTTHGEHGSPTYVSWSKMKERCNTVGTRDSKYYSEKGLRYDPSWEHFENFLLDMGNRPEGKTLDRIDPEKGYSKDNCRWSDPTIQSYNRGKVSSNTTGRTGVYLLSDGTYQSIITYYKDRIVLASGVTYEEAVKAREEGELKYYGWTKE